jgi:hypothetical protein
MANSPPTGGSDAVAAPLEGGMRRVRVRVRRRRARDGQRWRSSWTRSRRRNLRTVFVCAGALLLMGTALYFSLSSLGSGPSSQPPAVRTR